MESAGESREARSPEVSEHGLKENAIGFRDALIIGIASTAPAYSLAAVIGLVVVTVGVQAPAVLLASFIPMFFVATAFYYMNRADQDCGTTFSWVTRAMGPWAGWIGGWARESPQKRHTRGHTPQAPAVHRNTRALRSGPGAGEGPPAGLTGAIVCAENKA